MSTLAMASNLPSKKTAPLIYFLWIVSVLFVGILIFCYVITKRANPILLDERGKPVTSSTAHSHARH
jgi:hypothetical protein